MSRCKAIKKHPFGCSLFILIFRMFFIVTNYNIITIKPNNRMATALVVQANLGVRISDILKLTLSDIVYDAGRYRLDIIEQKTGKTRNFTVPNGLYDYLVGYAKENHIGEYARLFPVCERALQKQLAIIAEYLNIDGLSTHSFRKFYATEMYQNNDYDIELVRELLQHSSTAVTQKYIGISSKRIEIAINNHLCLA